MLKQMIRISACLLMTLSLHPVNAKIVPDFDMCSHGCLEKENPDERSRCCTRCGGIYLNVPDFTLNHRNEAIEKCILGKIKK